MRREVRVFLDSLDCVCVCVCVPVCLSVCLSVWCFMMCRIQVITDTSCEGAVTPEDYGEEYGVVDGWNDVHTATGLWQLLQVISFVCVCVRTSAIWRVRVVAVYVWPRCMRGLGYARP